MRCISYPSNRVHGDNARWDKVSALMAFHISYDQLDFSR